MAFMRSRVRLPSGPPPNHFHLGYTAKPSGCKRSDRSIGCPRKRMKALHPAGDELATSLSFFLQAPVLDKTDLERRSIFTAVEEQLGLTPEPSKGPVKMLVIDHVERPTTD
jgi:uncharacterized protein DUF3738